MVSIFESEEPPTKKRRFLEDPTSSPAPPSSSPVISKQRLFRDDDKAAGSPTTPSIARTPSEREPEDAFSIRSPSLRIAGAADAGEASSSAAAGNSSMVFDQEVFKSLVGDEVEPDVMRIIEQNCGGNIERAVNMYFDRTWEKFKQKSASKLSDRSSFSSSSVSKSTKSTAPRVNGELQSSLPPSVIRKSVPESHYIGGFGAEGWATRSGTNLLKHGDMVRIERQKIQPPRPGRLKGQMTLGPALSTQRVSAAAARRVDVIVRFTTLDGMEIGRLAKDTANWVSTLMDQKICAFEGRCVYAPEKLRTNDTVFIQIRCSLLRSAFYERAFQLADNRATGLFEQSETTEEKDLRLRQVALVRLFQEINLLPSRGNAAAAKSQREGLLEAAEIAENKEKDPSKSGGGNQTPAASDSAAQSDNDNEDGQELEQDQLDALYKKAQSFDFSTPEAEPADTFAMTLRPYQKQSLHWMMMKEKDERNKQRESSMHPLWEEYTWPSKDYDDTEVPQIPDQPTFYVNPYSGDLSLDFPVQEQHCLGGILADEMGLGKTIQILSLIHSHRSEVAVQARRSGHAIASVAQLPRLPLLPAGHIGDVDAPYTTLVVAPMSLLAQWQSEAENASKEGTLRSMVYYGTEKNVDLSALCCEGSAASAPDVIITSYGVVLSEFSQIASSKHGGDRAASRGLFSLNFFRVVLDEAHSIKNRQSKTARACYELSAQHRWVLTGTPIVNKLEDLFSLVRFLRVEPWNNFSFWRTFITVPFESKNFVRALDVVQTVLEPLVMRRTKDMRTPDGQPLVALPPKRIELVDVELSKAERDVYDYIFTRAKRAFFANVEAGTVLKAFTSIFAQILRLRQSCCHPVLVRNQEIVTDEVEAGAAADAAAGLADDMDLHALIERFTATTTEGDNSEGSNAFGAHVLRQIRDEAVNECPVCAEEPMVEQTVTGCWHSACKKCLLDYIEHQAGRHELPRCFNCREPINVRDLFEVVRHDDEVDDDNNNNNNNNNDPSDTPRISLTRLGVNDSSAKVVTLIKHLRALRKEQPHVKSVVFSQFTSFLSLIEPALTRANMRFLRLDGSMAQKARAAVLAEFAAANKFTVLLISLKAGGVGLNLTSAKRVYMMDPWWSFAVEAQAIDRVHRMGQEHEVRVYRFIVKDSVEERMLRIQDRKKFIASSLGMMSDEEKKTQRIEDIRELLS